MGILKTLVESAAQKTAAKSQTIPDVHNFFIIRLGADREDAIRRIDAVHSYSSDLFSINVKCKQVPREIGPGDMALIWLGTNNNKGGKTPWEQGLRALGRIERIA